MKNTIEQNIKAMSYFQKVAHLTKDPNKTFWISFNSQGVVVENYHTGYLKSFCGYSKNEIKKLVRYENGLTGKHNVNFYVEKTLEKF